ncbi:MAG: zinc ribbon domain-containing protein [Syntrophorhabdus sp.]
MPDRDKPALFDHLFPAQEKVNVFYFAGRCLVFILMLWTGIPLMVHMPSSEAAGQSFFHNISLPFHEAGHIFFSLLGDFMGVLGGSTMQVLVPVICLTVFLKKGDTFASSFAVWWTGQNFIDIAPYINDARAQKLMLLGGVTGEDVPGYHDWNTILGDLGILKLDHAIAYTAHFTGILLILCALTWASVTLYLQWKNLDR